MARNFEETPAWVTASGRAIYYVPDGQGRWVRRHGPAFEGPDSPEAIAWVEAKTAEISDLIAAVRDYSWYQFVVDVTASRVDKSLEKTVNTYLGRWNTHLLPAFGNQPVDATDPDVLRVVAENMGMDGYAPNTITGIRTAVSSFLKWGALAGLLSEDRPDPLGTKDLRNAVFTDARQIAKRHRPIEGRSLGHRDIPNAEELVSWGNAAERRYPGRGRDLLTALAGTGARPAEGAGFMESQFADRPLARIDGMATRGAMWPARTQVTKNHHLRDTVVWEEAWEAIERLKAKAVDGWLFPPIEGKERDWCGKLSTLIGEAARDAGLPYTAMSLRHHYVAYSLLPTELGGKGMPDANVTESVGHHSIPYTRATYDGCISGIAQQLATSGRSKAAR